MHDRGGRLGVGLLLSLLGLNWGWRLTGYVEAVLPWGLLMSGFAVLVVSDIRMLRDFGLVTVIDLAVALLGVLVVLPAVLVLAERGAFARVPVLRGRGRRGRVEQAPAA